MYVQQNIGHCLDLKSFYTERVGECRYFMAQKQRRTIRNSKGFQITQKSISKPI